MRRYLQGTLDFTCGIYAVVNALACTHNLDLSGARHILAETLLEFAEHPELNKRFMRNETDHYWVVQYALQRWCTTLPWKLHPLQPFSGCLLPRAEGGELAGTDPFLPEREEPSGPSSPEDARLQAEAVWRALREWFCPPAGNSPSEGDKQSGGNSVEDPAHNCSGGPESKMPRVAIFRFHRFLPGVGYPVVSHWTTACRLEDDVVYLHDASSERGAIFSLAKSLLIPLKNEKSLVRVVPESLLLLEIDSSSFRAFFPSE